MDKLKEISNTELALRNGQEREKVWCAFGGYIYDLGNSRLWENGEHYEHWAGQDLTEEFQDAPHDEKVFKRFNIIGRLV